MRQEGLIVRKTPIFDYFAWLLENKFVNTPSIYTLGNNFFRDRLPPSLLSSLSPRTRLRLEVPGRKKISFENVRAEC